MLLRTLNKASFAVKKSIFNSPNKFSASRAVNARGSQKMSTQVDPQDLEAVRDSVLKFWFEELTPEQWFFSPNQQEIDQTIKTKFGHLVEASRGESLDQMHEKGALDSLALVIIMDQFPRNIFRKSPKAFELDEKTNRIVFDGVARKYDEELAKISKQHVQFYLVPFMHLESLESLNACVDLHEKHKLDSKWAVEHREVFMEYGRYPYRNAALGRESTAAELEFLKTSKF